MNPYVIGGMGLIILILGWQLKASITRNGELSAKLETQVSETLEAADANVSNIETITKLEVRIKEMIDERRVDVIKRERVLVEREQELQRAHAANDKLRKEREDEIDENPDCKDLASLSVDFFCPATGDQLRQRSTGSGSDEDEDSGDSSGGDQAIARIVGEADPVPSSAP